MRHTEAAKIGGAITRDEDRPLTPRGEEEALRMGRALAAMEPEVEHIVTSPLVRAVQTAEIVRGALGGRPDVRITENLVPGFRPAALFAELTALAGSGGIMAVGHQPDLGEFIAFLIADSAASGISMAAGAIAKLLVPSPPDRSGAALCWLLTPDAVRSLQSKL